MIALRQTPPLLKNGDVVVLKATVKYDQKPDESIFVDIDGRYGALSIDPGAVLGFLHAHFEVGDPVLCGGVPGTIRAIYGSVAWIEMNDPALNLGFVTASLADLERVERPQPMPEALPLDVPVAAAPEIL